MLSLVVLSVIFLNFFCLEQSLILLIQLFLLLFFLILHLLCLLNKKFLFFLFFSLECYLFPFLPLRQRYDVIIEIECPDLLSLGFLVDDDFFVLFGILEDFIFWQDNRKVISFVVPAWRKF